MCNKYNLVLCWFLSISIIEEVFSLSQFTPSHSSIEKASRRDSSGGYSSMTRTRFYRQLSTLLGLSGSSWQANAFASSSSQYNSQQTAGSSKEMPTSNSIDYAINKGFTTNTVAYRSLLLPIEEFNVDVPVACWYPCNNNPDTNNGKKQGKGLTYQHRISVQRIGQLLAGWDFIPEFFSRDFQLEPMITTMQSSSPLSSTQQFSVSDGENIPFPQTPGPVVFLAHGFLGSRFDLSHLAESLAQEGFVCISPEFPESLAASYPRREGLDRSIITSRLIDAVTKKWDIKATRYGIIGHSLGCGTAIRTGDESWTRVIIAGYPKNRDGSSIPGNILYVASMNDGTVKLYGVTNKEQLIPPDFVELQEEELNNAAIRDIPTKAALLFDRVDGPNHISFLAEGVNNAMIELLSPLLPVAQALSIPVLDFDKYKYSRDSKQTADIVNPLVVKYLKQRMLV